MAKEASLSLLFLFFLIIFSSGTVVDFSYHEREDTASSSYAGFTFNHESKISKSGIRFSVSDYKILSTLSDTNLSVDFFLNENLVENFVSSKSSLVPWLEVHLVNILPQVDIRSIIVKCGSERLGKDEMMPSLIPILKSIHSFLTKLQLIKDIKVTVAFPLSFLENLNASYENDLLRIVMFVKKIDSFIMVEDNIDGESSIVQSVIERATLAASILPCKDVPIVFITKSLDIPTSIELAQFSETVSKYLEAGSHFTKRIDALYVQVHRTKDFMLKNLKREEEREEIFSLSLREYPNKVQIRRTLQDTTNSPITVFPTNPTPPTPVITPPDTPTIITVPSTNPVTVSPTNPTATPVTVPSTTPVSPLAPPTNPANPGAQPVTNPVTSYPPPSPLGGGPVTNALPPPPNTNTQAMPGQSWCVAKTGVPETTLQSALDYACGTASVDCSQIQQGGSCYNPNSIQNHASFAFNSYYQKNPAPTSCDFGGAATIVNTNPSSGSCVFPSSSGAGTSGSEGPSVLGSQSPPNIDTSYSSGLRPFLGCMVLVISLVTIRLTI